MSRGATRLKKDSAGGGKVVFTPVRGCTINSVEPAVQGAMVAKHGGTATRRTRPLRTVLGHRYGGITTFSKNVFIGGKPAVRQNDTAVCGHQLTGSSNVFIN